MIRPARPDEAEWARALVRRAYALYVPRMGREPAPMLADYGALIDAGDMRVLEDAGPPVALIVLRPDEDALFIENIAVDPAAQRKGHGRTLLAFAEREARRLGLKALRLYTNAAMTENLSYYPSLGFRETDRREEDGYKRVFFEKQVG
ncbi:MAG TPA: GNAT family N-acetyltransferase [Stellaceae bacterium]|nr:GNAT family N-acetyltransferase [Stellaceae bacterium]